MHLLASSLLLDRAEASLHQASVVVETHHDDIRPIRNHNKQIKRPCPKGRQDDIIHVTTQGAEIYQRLETGEIGRSKADALSSGEGSFITSGKKARGAKVTKLCKRSISVLIKIIQFLQISIFSRWLC